MARPSKGNFFVLAIEAGIRMGCRIFLGFEVREDCRARKRRANVGFHSFKQLMARQNRPGARDKDMERYEPAGPGQPGAERVIVYAFLQVRRQRGGDDLELVVRQNGVHQTRYCFANDAHPGEDDHPERDHNPQDLGNPWPYSPPLRSLVRAIDIGTAGQSN